MENLISWNKEEYQPLSNEEQLALVEQAQNGDVSASQKLVNSNLKLASKIANQFKTFNTSHHNDLLQEAILGLCQAVQKFDPSRGTAYTTYATFWAKSFVLKYLISNHHVVKFDTTAQNKKLFFRLSRERTRLIAEGTEPTVENLAEVLDVTTDNVKTMQTIMGNPAKSLNAPATIDSQESLQDAIPSESQDPEQATTVKQAIKWCRDKIKAFTAKLNDTEKIVWQNRIMADTKVKSRVLGDQLGCTRQYINLVEHRLIKDFTTYAQRRISA